MEHGAVGVGGRRAPAPPARVPFNDLRRFAASVADEVGAAVRRVVGSGWYLLGPETEAFEAEFAAACGVPHCVAVGNGTDALELALRSVGCAAGDEVVVAANAGMYATTACLAIGAVPVFADVEPGSLLLAPGAAAALVTERTRAVVATHLYGGVVDVDGLRASLPGTVAVVEDCAQAHGASLRGRPVGSLGDAAAFSFYPTKNLGAMGDAGAVVTADPVAERRARALRQYGWGRRYEATVPGGRNSRMDEIQAAVLRVLLPSLAARNARRRAIRDHYVTELRDRVRFVDASRAGAPGVVHLCVARSTGRDRLVADLHARGVECAVHYPVPDHAQPVLAGARFRAGALAQTERACREVFSLPCFPELTDDEVAAVVAAVRGCT